MPPVRAELTGRLRAQRSERDAKSRDRALQAISARTLQQPELASARSHHLLRLNLLGLVIPGHRVEHGFGVGGMRRQGGGGVRLVTAPLFSGSMKIQIQKSG